MTSTDLARPLAGPSAWRWRPVATYLFCAELCEAAYKRSVLPVWPLAKH